jgi:UDP-N-acetylglucosamine acyltransferase
MATTIHPTAFVAPGAVLGADCEIGPFAYVGEHARLGARNKLLHHACVEGHTTMGDDNEVGSFSVIGGKPQDLKYKGEPTRVEIGHRNNFRESVTVNAGTVSGGGITKMGSDCLIMAYCHVAHDCMVGDHVIMANYTGLSGHVKIEDWVILSGMCGITQFLTVGKHAFIGGMSAIRKDIAPYGILTGDPAGVRGVNRVGLKRRGFEGERLEAVLECYKVYFDSGLEKEQALAELDKRFPNQPDVRYFIDFARNSKYGISR